jgi:hypothetical protein
MDEFADAFHPEQFARFEELGEVSVRAGHIAPQDQEAALIWLGIKAKERSRRRATTTSYIALAISVISLIVTIFVKSR